MSLMHEDSAQTYLRWAAWLLVATSVATMIGRIAAVRATTGESPMLSANDRSRWCTVRALVEDGTYAIDRLVNISHPETKRRFWKSIDMVRHRGPDGREHYYSSKPTLFPTVLAGEYWLIRAITGATFENDPFFVMRVMIVITNVLPLLLYFVVLSGLVRRLAVTGGAYLFTMAAAAWGTFLTTFSVTINNHLVAAVCVLLAMALTLRIWYGERRWWFFAGGGLCAALAAANELPALALLACVAVATAWKSPRGTLIGFVPAVVLVAAGFFGTNYLAHGTWTPAYAHRGDGRTVATVARHLVSELDQKNLPESVREQLKGEGIQLSGQTVVLVYQPGRRWGIWDRAGAQRYALVATDTDIDVRVWGNWYDYQGSYWQTNREGVDRGEQSAAVYAWHVLVGHHGIFTLTPIWLLSVGGCVFMLRGRPVGWKAFGWMVVAVSLVCLAFYLSRPVADRNYGGVSCGFRWMFWFIPLWLLCLVPAADWLVQRRWGLVLLVILLLVSTFSATYAASNPWSHPWLFDWGTYAGWWRY